MAVIGAAAIGAAATIFGSSSSSKAAKAQAEAQKEAAQLQTLVARELHDHWKAYYKQCDINFINEVCATPVYVPQYETVSARARMEILSSFGRARQQLYKCQDVFCVGKIAQDCNFISGIEAIALADAINFGFRREENLKIQLDQMRFENIRTVLAQGRNLLTQSANASNIAAGVGARTGAQAGNAANGWLQFAGFLQTPEGKALQASVGKGLSSIFGSSNTPTWKTPAGETGAFDMMGSQGTGLAGSEPQQANPGDTSQSPYVSSDQLFPGGNFSATDTANAAAAAGA